MYFYPMSMTSPLTADSKSYQNAQKYSNWLNTKKANNGMAEKNLLNINVYI